VYAEKCTIITCGANSNFESKLKQINILHDEKTENVMLSFNENTFRRQTLWAAISALHISSPFSTMHMSRTRLVSGHEQQMRGFSSADLLSTAGALAGTYDIEATNRCLMCGAAMQKSRSACPRSNMTVRDSQPTSSSNNNNDDSHDWSLDYLDASACSWSAQLETSIAGSFLAFFHHQHDSHSSHLCAETDSHLCFEAGCCTAF
jgi:hypothetical protein